MIITNISIISPSIVPRKKKYFSREKIRGGWSPSVETQHSRKINTRTRDTLNPSGDLTPARPPKLYTRARARRGAGRGARLLPPQLSAISSAAIVARHSYAEEEKIVDQWIYVPPLNFSCSSLFSIPRITCSPLWIG